MFRRWAIAVLVSLSITAYAVPAHSAAVLPNVAKYTIDLTGFSGVVDTTILFAEGTSSLGGWGGSSRWWAFGEGVTEFTAWNFPPSPIVSSSFAMGLTNDGVDHLVLFISQGACSGGVCSSGMSGTSEAALIDALKSNALNYDDSTETLISSASDASKSLWFGPNQPFYVVKFSDGAIIGSGVMAPVPEASEWAMLAAGLGIVGFVARRRRSEVGPHGVS